MKFPITLFLAFALVACGSNKEDDSSSVWARAPTSEQTSSAPSDEASADGEENKESGEEKKPETNPAKLPAGQQPTTGCERFYVLGKEPKIIEPRLKETLEPKMEKLCYRAFAIGYSGLTRTPIWVGEALNARQLQYARSISRASEFQPDPNLASENRAELTDYRRSGYDRGHMAPSADMPTREAQAESFYLSNIVAQNATLNGGKWARLEQSVRRLAMKHDVFVITGPIFQNANKALQKRVLVPTSVFKAIFVDGEGAVVYIAENKANGRWNTMTIDQFASVYGIDLYPGLPPLVRANNYATGGSLRNKGVKYGKESGASSGEEKAKKKGRMMASENGTGLVYPIDEFREMHGRMPREDELVEY